MGVGEQKIALRKNKLSIEPSKSFRPPFSKGLGVAHVPEGAKPR